MAIKIKKATPHKNRPYKVEPYTPDWPTKFKKASASLKELLGDEAVAIEHVGSTAVPGMQAKPQIDILILVKDIKNIPKLYKAMSELGYEAHGDWAGDGEEYFTLDNAAGEREVSVHIFPTGHRHATDLLDVRDYLRAHPSEVDYYSRIKLEAKRKHPEDYAAYYEAKLNAINKLRQRAARWAGH